MDKSTLLQQAMEGFVVLNRVIVNDDLGVPSTTYQEGAAFQAVAKMIRSTEMEIAQQQGAKRVYSLYFAPVLPVEQGMILRRVRDGLTFRVNATPDTRETPAFSSIPLKYTTMEVIVL